MNEIKNEQDSGSDHSMNSRRNFIRKAGVAGPVIMTLASRPVFATQCYSNMMSGNLSNPTRGDHCKSGSHPDHWKGPHTDVMGSYCQDAWSSVGCNYGTPKYSNSWYCKTWQDYTGGSYCPSDLTGAGHPLGNYSSKRLRQAINEMYESNDARMHLLAGWFNKQYLQDSYFIKSEDFYDLYYNDPNYLAGLIAANYDS